MLFGLVAAALALPAQAKENANEEVTYSFKPYNFITLQGGLAHTRGEIDFGDLLSPAAAISFGRQHTPIFGWRVGVGGWESKGGWVNPYTDYKYNYVALNADALFNLSNVFSDWKPRRVFNLYAFVGLGVNYAFNNDEAKDLEAALPGRADGRENLTYLWNDSRTSVLGRAGLQADFRLSDRWSLNVEANANGLSDHYNSKKADNIDWYFNGLVGVTYKLSKGYTETRTAHEAPAPAPAPQRPETRPAPKPAPAPVAQAEPLRREIFFDINRTTVADSEQGKIDELVRYLNANPQAKVQISGYADAQTGNQKINQALSEKRVASVKSAIEKAGIDPQRVTTGAYGDKQQPFADNDSNRVAICIAE
jgi:outer membrane protein OmpA-like peptidoglycan-associated protein